MSKSTAALDLVSLCPSSEVGICSYFCLFVLPPPREKIASLAKDFIFVILLRMVMCRKGEMGDFRDRVAAHWSVEVRV